MAKKEKKATAAVDEWADERAAAQAQLDKTAAKRAGADNPGVIVEEGRVLVKLPRPTPDGRQRAAVEFPTDKAGEKLLAGRAPKEVGWAPVPVLEHLEWLRSKPIKWLRDEAVARAGVAPKGDLPEAIAAYLGALYQLDSLRERAKDPLCNGSETFKERIETLERGLEWHRTLADIPGLTGTQLLVAALTKKVPQTTHTEDRMFGEDAKPETTEAEPKPSIVKKKVAPAPAPEAAKAEKKERKARVADPSKLDVYGKKKLAAQKELPVGKAVQYDGKAAKVARHEARGGVFIDVGGKERLVSPFQLLPKKPKPAKEKKPKAEKKSKKK